MRVTAKYVLASALALLLVVPSFAQQPLNNPLLPTPAPYGPPWYREPDALKALNINEHQLGRLNEAYSRVQTRFQEDLNRDPNLTQQERAERLRTLGLTSRQNLMRAFSGILDDKQMARYQQLDLQLRGWEAFADPAVQRQLTLSGAQQRQLEGLSEQWNRGMRDLDELGRTNREQALRGYQELQTRTREQVNSVFTNEQRRAWSNLIGEPHTFPPPFAGTNR
jgi:hypothetical protein